MSNYKIKFYFGNSVRCIPYPSMQQWQTRSFPGGIGESGVSMGRPGRIISISGQYREKASSYADGVEKIYRKWINPMAERFDGANNWYYDDLFFKKCILLDFKPQQMVRSGKDVILNFTATIKSLDISE